MSVTVVTAISPWHQEVFVRCADSVRRQTLYTRHIHMIDKDAKGPGVIRNELMKQVKTKYVVFLDADDYLEPTFIEKCFAANDPEHYVYTNWMEGETEKSTPEGAFWDTAWHLVTCLIHTDMIRLVGGFDEQLAAMEDTDLFLKFDSYNYCGICVPEPLVHYTNQGRRSTDARAQGLNESIKRTLFGRYKVGCCNNPNKTQRPPVGAKVKGDVLVQALWAGNQFTGGAVTGRRYPRASRPMKIWVNAEDAIARPDLYRILPPKDKPKKASRQPVKPVKLKRPRTFADMLHAAGMLQYKDENPIFVPSLVAADLHPDYEKLNALAMRIYKPHEDKSEQRIVESSPGTDSKAIIVRPEPIVGSGSESALRSQPT